MLIFKPPRPESCCIRYRQFLCSSTAKLHDSIPRGLWVSVPRGLCTSYRADYCYNNQASFLRDCVHDVSPSTYLYFNFMRLFSAKLLLHTRSYLTSSKNMATRTVLILGSGPRIGDAVSEKFAADGYKVALVSRKGTNSINEKGYLSLQADFANTDPSIIASIFDKVKSEFNAPPSVVIYNAGSITPPPDENSVLSIPSASQP